ncbi:hypothetical protein BDV95DRAFT_593811 [Massariosphaeria phaeospora]|uniref:Uncharacterized protein n=1 Tax=Massariosphaeria phaeospora TaxID=100035 RepID=A0A7C8I774_9PLEO|nr:hypothetical protein BDV95DRAFT_593811 [Massariosphaeria phaeospora]
MPIRRAHHTTTTPHTTRATRTTARPSLKTRLLGPRRSARHTPAATTTTTTTTRTTRTTHAAHPTTRTTHAAHPTTGVHHQKRRPSMGDKISGALTRIKGTLTGRSGKKAAGTRRMNGTDGRGARRTVY